MDLKAKYRSLCHAMQSAIAFRQNKKDQEPKHLRVGINSAHVSDRALATLLIEKGIITEAELDKALVDAMQTEIDEYKALIAEEQGIHPSRLNFL